MSSPGDPKAAVRVGPSVASASLFDEPDDSATVVEDGLFGEQQTDVPNYPAIATFGRFEILGRIALGGMAEVFLARETGVNGVVRHLVIKRVLPHVADDEDFIAMFVDEATISTRLYHPNVCHMYEAGEIDGAYFMAMEWVHGTPLRRVIRRSREMGGIPAPIACEIIRKVAEALHYTHTARDAEGRPLGIVHRDVSPHNMMVRWDGAVKLLDFGIAKAATQEAHTEAGVVKGKYSYLSPEQCHGKDVDGRSDIFALGICLFEALTGKPLYHRGSVLNTMTAIASEEVPRATAVNPDIPPELDAILGKALAKAPGDRFQGAQQMAAALEGYLQHASQEVPQPRVAAFLDTLFTEAERSPIPESTLRQTGSFPQLTPSGAYAESGSFGPFGQAPRVSDLDAIEIVDIDVLLEPASEGSSAAGVVPSAAALDAPSRLWPPRLWRPRLWRPRLWRPRLWRLWPLAAGLLLAAGLVALAFALY